MADEGFKRKLTAILSADVVGYSLLMENNEEATIQTLTTYRNSMSNLIQQYRGRVVDTTGDNLLAEFTSAVDAVNCAVEIQRDLAERNAELTYEQKMEFRIGVNVGDIVEEKDRIYGEGVNIAARVESMADSGGICISGRTFDQVANKLDLEYENLGEHQVKNISTPIRVYRVLSYPGAAAHRVVRAKETLGRRWRKIGFSAAAIVIVAVVIGVWQFSQRGLSVEPASVEKMVFPLPEKPSIAVLPFDNMSGDPSQEYIADGITENIITALSMATEMFVIARNSTFTYKGKPVKISQVSEELGVRYVLEGSFQKEGNRVRITAQLIDAIKGHHLWAERYDRNIESLFDVLDEITKKIGTTLQVKMTWGDAARYMACTDNFEAWSYLTKGYSLLLRLDKNDNIKARELFEKALELDPEYGCALILIAGTHFMDMQFGWSESPAKSFKQVVNQAEKASALVDANPGLNSLLGWIYLFQGQHGNAIAQGEKAIALSPNYDRGYFDLAVFMHYAGRFEESIEYVKRAMRLSPYYPTFYLSILSNSYILSGRYEEAISVDKLVLDRYKKQGGNLFQELLTHIQIAEAYVELGREDEGRAHTAQVLKMNPNFSLEQWQLMHPYKITAHLDRRLQALRKAGLPENPPLKLPDKPSIAVLPFVNMSGDHEQQYFSDGISEDIITALSKTPKLFVIARTSSFKYKGKEADIRTVGRELGVRYVLEGSVRRAEDKVRITAQLIDATTDKHLWAERYDRNLGEIFAIQDEITLAIIKAMQVELTKGEMADLTGKGTKNLDAYLKALQAQEQWWRMNKQSTLKAKQLALEAIAIDAQYGYPYAIVSWSHMMDVWLQSSESPQESMQLAVEAIQKALTLDEFDYRIHIVLSNLYVMQRKNDKAISSAQRALELCPGGAFAHAVMGTALRYACRFDESVKFREQAIKLDPFPTAMDYRNLALSYSRVARYDDAIAEYKKALHTNPNDWVVHFGMAGAYAKLNRKEKARIATEELLRIRPDFSLDWLAETTVPMYAKECRLKINDDIEFLRKADVGLQ